jgi:hypothetical protein
MNEMHNRQWLQGKGADYKVFKNSLATMYAHISYNNKEFGKIYIEYMFNHITQNDYQIVRRFERPLLLLMQL